MKGDDSSTANSGFCLPGLFGVPQQVSHGQEPVGTFEASLSSINNAKAFPHGGFIQAEGGSLLTSTYWLSEQADEFRSHLKRRPWLKLSQRTISKAVSLPLYWSSNYYHWICDVLPRLRLISSLEPSRLQFLVPHPFKQWMVDSLRCFDISESQCIPIRGPLSYKIKTLLFPEPLAMTGDHDEEALKWTRSKILGATATFPACNSKRIYVSRRQAIGRRIVNEQELLKILKAHNFEIIEAENLTFSDQMKKFSEATLILAPHGAGLTNMIAARQNCKVIEIFEPSIIRRCYFQMARSLQLDYGCVVGLPVANSQGEPDIFLPAEILIGLNSLLGFQTKG